MASTSAAELLRRCIEDGAWPQELAREVFASREFFSVVVERLGDLFEPRLVDVYARLFSEAAASVDPSLSPAELLARYERVRRTRRCTLDEPANVYVLSRITLGADVVVTSTLMSAVMRRFPSAHIWFVGPRKNYDLFAGVKRIERLAMDYPRGGTLAERLDAWRQLAAFFSNADGIVVDPDSRLTQLGLLPVCDDERYFFFESRAYGGDGDETLAALAGHWCAETFGVEGARPFVAPVLLSGRYAAAISLGVGENPEKRIADPFERELLEWLAPRDVIVDKGAGGEESARVERAAAGLDHVSFWQGAYAPFASLITQSRMYIGYDSAGQHVAAAAGVPLISVFAGYVSERMFQRWKPSGPGRIEVVQVAPGEPPQQVLARTREAARRLLPQSFQ